MSADEDSFDKTNSKEFEQEDTFNPGNIIKGLICRSPSRSYGRLTITHVNGRECPQVIYGTPKMFYPLDNDRSVRRMDYKEIMIYEKYDGTNVVGYKYHDADGNEYVTYKTRMTPTINKECEYQDFHSMWSRMLERYPQIDSLVRDCPHGYNYSFELYGKENLIIFLYEDVDLDTVLLFAITDDAEIIAPRELLRTQPGRMEGIPTATLRRTVQNTGNGYVTLVEEYARAQSELESKFRVENEDDPERREYYGLEGEVWYFTDRNDKVIQFKCKPPSFFDMVLESRKIPAHSVVTTIVNAMEDNDLSFEHVKEMLMEEYAESVVMQRAAFIDRTIQEMEWQYKTRGEVIADYEREGFDIVNRRGECMRYFGRKYPKRIAGTIFGMLWAEFGEGDPKGRGG